MAFEELLEKAGGAGLFQTLHVITICFPSIFLPAHMLLENFSAAIPGHRCWVHMLDNSSEVPTNLTPKALLAVSIPPGPNQEPDQCRRFRQPQWQLLDPNATATNWSEAATEPCVDGWVYDHGTFTSTIVTKWDLVCDSQGLKPLAQSIFMSGGLVGTFIWGLLSNRTSLSRASLALPFQWDLVCDSQGLKPLAQSIFMSGGLVGTFIWGLLSNRFGRRPMVIWSLLQVAVSGTVTIFAPNFVIYCGLRFASAFGLAGFIMASVTLVMEWIATRRRTVAMTILGCIFGTGQLVLAGLAFVLRDWRALQLAVSVPFFVFFLIFWWMAESARWLIIMGKPDQALLELQKVARINGHKEAKKTLTIESHHPNIHGALLSPEVLTTCMEEEVASSKAQQSVWELFRLPVLRRRTSVLVVVHFSLMISYYGMVLDLQSLGRDIFLLQALFGAIDLLSRAATSLVFRFMGRRLTMAGFQALAGCCILANLLVPQDLQTLRVAFAVLGRGCFGINLTCITLYMAELFPTSLRLMANGFLTSVGRLGAMMGPLLRMTRQAMPLLPPLSYGIIPMVSSLAVLLFLPETKGLSLPDTIQDLESQ
ncbi:Solute carrier family 22 member 11 [Tupaia chinensis]|uniref:Solute carrier family 22 member 11 n=1 Tax=Tupaia chinensis TaxID=246437 RepID=L9KRI7_TUPCH|nr:Solute carrier family 22 member 11 [Tupaia chinensis]